MATKSVIAKIIKKEIDAQFSHSSISLTPDLYPMYSFARRLNYFPFWGGFIQERIDKGCLKRFKRANCKVLKIDINDDQFLKLSDHIDSMYKNKFKYKYDVKGVFKAKKGIVYKRDKHYYCSAFIKECLEMFNIIPKDELPEITLPDDLLKIKEAKVIYGGELCLYKAMTE